MNKGGVGEFSLRQARVKEATVKRLSHDDRLRYQQHANCTSSKHNHCYPPSPLAARALSVSTYHLINIKLADHCAETDTHDHHSKSQYHPKVRAQLPHQLELAIKPPRLNTDLITITCYTRSAHL